MKKTKKKATFPINPRKGLGPYTALPGPSSRLLLEVSKPEGSACSGWKCVYSKGQLGNTALCFSQKSEMVTAEMPHQALVMLTAKHTAA